MPEDRYICTRENPWSAEKGKATHPDAVVILDEGDYEKCACPNCSLQFWVEIAQ